SVEKVALPDLGAGRHDVLPAIAALEREEIAERIRLPATGGAVEVGAGHATRSQLGDAGAVQGRALGGAAEVTQTRELPALVVDPIAPVEIRRVAGPGAVVDVAPEVHLAALGVSGERVAADEPEPVL